MICFQLICFIPSRTESIEPVPLSVINSIWICFYFLLPDELRELFAPLLDKAIKEAKKREKAEKTAKPKKPVIKVEEPEYLDDDEEFFDDDFENEWNEEEGYTEEVIGIAHRHYDSLGDFLTHLNDHDSFDSVLAVQDFWHNANVIESKNAVVTLYASVVYVIRLTGKILYRSTEPIEVRIDTENLNSITIPDLPSGCVNMFSADKEVMNYSFGVLTIEGEDNEHTPFVVSLI